MSIFDRFFIITFLCLSCSFSEALAQSEIKTSSVDSIVVISFNDFFDTCIGISRHAFLSQYHHNRLRDTIITSKCEIDTIISALNSLELAKTQKTPSNQLSYHLIYQPNNVLALEDELDGDNRMLMILLSPHHQEFIWFAICGIHLRESLFLWNDQIRELVNCYCNAFQ